MVSFVYYHIVDCQIKRCAFIKHRLRPTFLIEFKEPYRAPFRIFEIFVGPGLGVSRIISGTLPCFRGSFRKRKETALLILLYIDVTPLELAAFLTSSVTYKLIEKYISYIVYIFFTYLIFYMSYMFLYVLILMSINICHIRKLFFIF